MKKLKRILPVIFILFLILPVVSGCRSNPLVMFEETREMMDTFIRIVVYAEEETGHDALNAAFDRMQEISDIADSWNDTGEAWDLNETGYLENPSAELLDMVLYSLEYNELTNGYFDITVQPLLDLWSYNPAAEVQFWDLDPAERQMQIDQALLRIGIDKIAVVNGTIRLAEGTQITLGGIAKGYAGDQALLTLADMGIEHALIDAGGDIKTLGNKPDGTKWNITLINPDDTTQFLADYFVAGMAVTTSGNYERYFNPDKTVHHILNPKTGYSASECISVTIIAETGTKADALATGVFAMGPEKGLELIESLSNTEVMIVDSNRNIIRSSGLAEYMGQE